MGSKTPMTVLVVCAVLASQVACSPDTQSRIVAFDEFGGQVASSDVTTGGIGSSVSALTATTENDAVFDRELQAPRQTRFLRYRNNTGNPDCTSLASLPIALNTPMDAPWLTIASTTFRTSGSTSYISLLWSGQFTVRTQNASTDTFAGIVGRATLSWQEHKSDVVQTRAFAGLGDTYLPWIARRERNETSRQYYSSIASVVSAPAHTEVTVTVEVQAWGSDAYVCLQRVTLQND